MKHNKVLHRPMFNAHNSAYGRGITANLVSEEQRIRYNSGGRVGLKYGSEYLMKIPGISKITNKLFPKGSSYGKFYDKHIAPKTPSGSGYFGTGIGTKEKAIGTKIGGWGAQKAKGLWQSMKDRPFTYAVPGGAAAYTFWPKDKPTLDDTDTGPSKFKDAFKTTKKPTKVDPDSDTLDWTPQEKKEKIGQIQLKLAQRLVGGARDPWGSKAQMKNIGDAFGDVAAIGDKTELRKDERKYKAWGKQQRQTAAEAHKLATSYDAILGKTGDHTTALAATTGITGTLNRPADKKLQKEADKKIVDRGPGTPFYDEESQSWRITTPDGKAVKVTIEELIEGFKSGKIDELRKKPADQETTEVIEETDINEPTVASMSDKGVIDTSNPQVLGGGMPFFNKFDF